MGRKAKVIQPQLKLSDDSFLDSIVDKFGENVLSTVRGDSVESMTTGSISLDASIGIGGIPKGRFTEIYGPEGSGKTTIALTIAKLAIDRGEKVLYIDAENMLSHKSIESILGEELPANKLILLQPETAEQAIMIAEKGITSDEFSLIVIDSVAALAPETEKNNEFDDQTVALLSRILAKFFRRNASDVKNHNVAFLLINQVRDKVGSYTGGYSSPGGHALKHFCSVIIPLTKGQDLKLGDEKIGINTRFVIKKNKLGPPFRSFEIPILFGKGVDYYSDLVSFSETLGILTRSGAFYRFEGDTVGQGKVATANTLRENAELTAKVVAKVYSVLGKQPSVSEDDSDSTLDNSD